MQPDKANAAAAAMIGKENARARRTGAIPQNEIAPVLHLTWLIKGLRGDYVHHSGAMRQHRTRIDNTALCRDAGADRAGHAGAAEPAIAGRILGQILLMVILGEVKFAGRQN